MADDTQNISPFALLQRLCARRESGMMFVVTTENRQIRIALERGAIVHVGFGPRRGRAALELLPYMKSRSAAFSASAPVIRDENLPPQDALMKALATTLSRSADGDAVRSSAAVPPQIGGAERAADGDDAGIRLAAAGVGGTDISPFALTRIKLALIELVGPIGELLVDEELAVGVDSVDGLVDRLAAGVGTEAPRFRAAVEQALAAPGP